MKGPRKAGPAIVIGAVVLALAFLLFFYFSTPSPAGWQVWTTGDTSESGRSIGEGPEGQFDYEGQWRLESAESAFQGIYHSGLAANSIVTISFKGSASYSISLTGLTTTPLGCAAPASPGRSEVNDSRADVIVSWTDGNECQFTARTKGPLSSQIGWRLRPSDRPFELDFAARLQSE